MEERHASSHEGTDHIFFAFHIKMVLAVFVAVQSKYICQGVSSEKIVGWLHFERLNLYFQPIKH